MPSPLRDHDSLVAAFLAQAHATPSAIAVDDGRARLSYRQLDDASARIASALRRHRLAHGSLVGVSLQRSAALVASLLGVLRAGCAYVPLDPAYPAERRALIVRDAAVAVVLSEQDDAAIAGLPTLAPSQLLTLAAQEEPLELGREDLAYVIYTSGSTGTPKGVCVTHGNVLALLAATDEVFELDAHDVWTLFHSYSFDFSVWELFGALLHGARLLVVDEETASSPSAFLELLSSARVTVLNQVPSVFRYLVEARARRPEARLALRYVIFGGEAIDRAVIERWRGLDEEVAPASGDADVALGAGERGNRPAELVNMYGITETTVHVTHKRLAREALHGAGPTPIGRPLAHLRVELCDEALEPVSTGEVGEICVLGAGVARGYLRRPELNEQRFVWLRGERAYRSGDLGRLRADGELEYIGRADQQLKIRGFRIEPGEIEVVLRALAQIDDAAVVAQTSPQGEPMLVAFVTAARADEPPLPARLRTQLARILPRHMVPGRFVVLDELPLGASGKTDRRELARMALR